MTETNMSRWKEFDGWKVAWCDGTCLTNWGPHVYIKESPNAENYGGGYVGGEFSAHAMRWPQAVRKYCTELWKEMGSDDD